MQHADRQIGVEDRVPGLAELEGQPVVASEAACRKIKPHPFPRPSPNRPAILHIVVVRAP